MSDSYSSPKGRYVAEIALHRVKSMPKALFIGIVEVEGQVIMTYICSRIFRSLSPIPGNVCIEISDMTESDCAAVSDGYRRAVEFLSSLDIVDAATMRVGIPENRG